MADSRPDFDDNAHILVDGIVVIGAIATPIRIGGALNGLTEYVIIENRGSFGQTLTLGGPGVSFGSGLTLRPNQKATLSCCTGSPFFAISDGASVDLYVAEMGS